MTGYVVFIVDAQDVCYMGDHTWQTRKEAEDHAWKEAKKDPSENRYYVAEIVSAVDAKGATAFDLHV